MNATQNQFLRNTVAAAQNSQRTYGVPASITLAQAILESGWGQSLLAVKGNNYFGVKASAHTAPDQYIEFPTTEFVDGRKTTVLATHRRVCHTGNVSRHSTSLLLMTRRSGSDFTTAFGSSLHVK